eukprot:62085-Pleurochrysis_carterae.AAC.1
MNKEWEGKGCVITRATKQNSAGERTRGGVGLEEERERKCRKVESWGVGERGGKRKDKQREEEQRSRRSGDFRTQVTRKSSRRTDLPRNERASCP